MSLDKTVEHTHYKKWPSRSLPETQEEIDTLLGIANGVSNFLINENTLFKNGEIQAPRKILVHGKDGFGRTGTFIALVNAIMTIKEQKRIGIKDP